MNELAYANHCADVGKAEELLTSLREMYGGKQDVYKLTVRARLDGVITKDECDLIRRVYR